MRKYKDRQDEGRTEDILENRITDQNMIRSWLESLSDDSCFKYLCQAVTRFVDEDSVATEIEQKEELPRSISDVSDAGDVGDDFVNVPSTADLEGAPNPDGMIWQEGGEHLEDVGQRLHDQKEQEYNNLLKEIFVKAVQQKKWQSLCFLLAMGNNQSSSKDCNSKQILENILQPISSEDETIDGKSILSIVIKKLCKFGKHKFLANLLTTIHASIIAGWYRDAKTTPEDKSTENQYSTFLHLFYKGNLDKLDDSDKQILASLAPHDSVGIKKILLDSNIKTYLAGELPKTDWDQGGEQTFLGQKPDKKFKPIGMNLTRGAENRTEHLFPHHNKIFEYYTLSASPKSEDKNRADRILSEIKKDIEKRNDNDEIFKEVNRAGLTLYDLTRVYELDSHAIFGDSKIHEENPIEDEKTTQAPKIKMLPRTPGKQLSDEQLAHFRKAARKSAFPLHDLIFDYYYHVRFSSSKLKEILKEIEKFIKNKENKIHLNKKYRGKHSPTDIAKALSLSEIVNLLNEKTEKLEEKDIEEKTKKSSYTEEIQVLADLAVGTMQFSPDKSALDLTDDYTLSLESIKNFISKIHPDTLKDRAERQLELLKPLLNHFRDQSKTYGKIILAQIMNEVYPTCDQGLKIEIDDFFKELNSIRKDFSFSFLTTFEAENEEQINPQAENFLFRSRYDEKEFEKEHKNTFGEGVKNSRLIYICKETYLLKENKKDNSDGENVEQKRDAKWVAYGYTSKGAIKKFTIGEEDNRFISVPDYADGKTCINPDNQQELIKQLEKAFGFAEGVGNDFNSKALFTPAHKSSFEDLIQVHKIQKMQRKYGNHPDLRKKYIIEEKSKNTISEETLNLYADHQRKIFSTFSDQLYQIEKNEIEEKKLEIKDEKKLEQQIKNRDKLNERHEAEDHKIRRRLDTKLYESSHIHLYQLFYALTDLGISSHKTKIIIDLICKEPDGFKVMFSTLKAEVERGHISVKDLYQFYVSALLMVWKPKADWSKTEATIQHNTNLFNNFAKSLPKTHRDYARVEKLQQEFAGATSFPAGSTNPSSKAPPSADELTVKKEDGMVKQAIIIAMFLKYGTLGEVTDPRGGKSGMDDDSARIRLLQQFSIDKTELDTLRIDQLVQRVLDFSQLRALIQPVIDIFRNTISDTPSPDIKQEEEKEKKSLPSQLIEDKLTKLCENKNNLKLLAHLMGVKSEEKDPKAWLRKHAYQALTKEFSYNDFQGMAKKERLSALAIRNTSGECKEDYFKRCGIVSIFEKEYAKLSYSEKKLPIIKGLKQKLYSSTDEAAANEALREFTGKTLPRPRIQLFSTNAGIIRFQENLKSSYETAISNPSFGQSFQ